MARRCSIQLESRIWSRTAFSISRISGRYLASRAASEAAADLGGVEGLQLLGGDLEVERSARAQAARSARAAGSAGARVLVGGGRGRGRRRRAGPRAPRRAGRPGSAGGPGRSGGPRSRGGAWGGARRRRRRCGIARRPRRPGPRGRSGAAGPARGRRGSGASRSGRAARPPSGRRGCRASAWMRRTISARSRPAQSAGSMARANLWWTQPLSERRPQSGRRNSRAGDRSIFWSELGGLLVEELLEVVAAELELVAVGAGVLLEVAVLEVELEPLVGPAGQGLPGPFRRVGVGGEVLLHRLADRLVELALGPGRGRSPRRPRTRRP